MTVLYVDTSALLKRVFVEADSMAVRTMLREAYTRGDLLTASSLAWVEVWQSLRRAGVPDVDGTGDVAVSGIAEFPLTDAVLVRARHVGQQGLRSLDAIHLASAIAVGADGLVTYDQRLAESASAVGLRVLVPGD